MLVMLGFTDGAAGLWILLFLSFANGILRSSQMTTTSSLIPNLVPKEHLLNAIALNQATQQGSRMVGALALIPLLAWLDIHTAFWLCRRAISARVGASEPYFHTFHRADGPREGLF